MLKKFHGALSAQLEGLEPRQLLSRPAPIEKFSQPIFYFNDIQASATGGTGASPEQYLIIRNAGVLPLRFNSKGLRFIGDDAADFVFTGKKTPCTILPGKTRTIPVAFNASRVGIETGTLLAVSNDTKHHSVSMQLRGLGTAGTGGSLEPSLQRILDLYQLPDNVGETNPDQNAFPANPAQPNDEIILQTMEKADASQPVTVDLLGVFDNFKSPATTFGWYDITKNTTLHDVFTVPMADAQSVHPHISSPTSYDYTAMNTATSFDPGSAEFGIYTVFPAFSNRHAYSQDGLNSWESNSARLKKVRMYPLLNADRTAVPNAYIFATEDYNVSYDSNDVVGIIRNVTPGPNATKQVNSTPPPPSTGGTGSIFSVPNLTVQNLDTLPANDRVVLNRIENPDPLRPNVVHDEGFIKLTNKGGSAITIDSISVDDSTDFNILSGGGTNITLGGGQSLTISVQFVGTGTGTEILKTFSTSLKIASGGKTDTVTLAALWQAYSEQTPADPHHVYDEPSVSMLVNTLLGYQIDIADAGQYTKHGYLVELGTHGDGTAVGSEVLSDYWARADGSQPVKVRQLAAWHRQNNFDPTTGAAETAASGIRWFYEGQPDTTTKLFVHNLNEGQSWLPNISNSTTAPAQASFNPSGAFAFKVDHQYSVDSLNTPDFDPTTGVAWPEPTGHAFRFYPLVDENGKTVPNTYVVVQDYTALSYSNYDYNDNLYIISNITPAGAAPMAAGVTNAKASSAGTASLWSSTAIDGAKGTSDVLGATQSNVL